MERSEHTSVGKGRYLAPACAVIGGLPQAIAAASTKEKDAIEIRVDYKTLSEMSYGGEPKGLQNILLPWI